jgi:hypothetical protein
VKPPREPGHGFATKAARIASQPREKWQKLAHTEAAAYRPYSGRDRNRNRKLIAELLSLLAADPTGQGLQNYRRRAFWADDSSPQTLEPHRVRDRFTSLRHGAELIGRFGGGRCLVCGCQLSRLREHSGSTVAQAAGADGGTAAGTLLSRLSGEASIERE